MTEQIPTIGRIVHYRLKADDANQINQRRTTGKSIADRMGLGSGYYQEPAASDDIRAWPVGAQAHIGTSVAENDVFPMIITRIWGSTATSAVNGQVFLDGNDVFWATSRTVGDQPGTFSWPTRS